MPSQRRNPQPHIRSAGHLRSCAGWGSEESSEVGVMPACRGCKQQKLVSEFYVRADRPGTLRSHCKACMGAYADRNREQIRERQRNWARAHPESAAAKYARSTTSVKAQAVAWQRASRAAHPDLWRLRGRANGALRRAIKAGQICRPDICEECGRSGIVIEGAHEDYARPLDVRWLCRRCHRRWDKADPKLLRRV